MPNAGDRRPAVGITRSETRRSSLPPGRGKTCESRKAFARLVLVVDVPTTIQIWRARPDLEFLTQPHHVSERDDAGGEVEERFVDVVAAFPADA